MSDTFIFIIGALVTVIWGSMVAALLYAANTTFPDGKIKEKNN